jgi:hypothetical protein
VEKDIRHGTTEKKPVIDSEAKGKKEIRSLI